MTPGLCCPSKAVKMQCGDPDFGLFGELFRAESAECRAFRGVLGLLRPWRGCRSGCSKMIISGSTSRSGSLELLGGRWVADRLGKLRNGMLGEGYSSKLSPWLALGCISPRRIWKEVGFWFKAFQRVRRSATKRSAASRISLPIGLLALGDLDMLL